MFLVCETLVVVFGQLPMKPSLRPVRKKVFFLSPKKLEIIRFGCEFPVTLELHPNAGVFSFCLIRS